MISIATATMRAMYTRFPELVLVDCTHKTNKNNYQLCSFMVIDENGHGQVVQHSLLETNSDWHMLCALRHFVRAHPTSERELKVFMVDKDLNEIRVLVGQFPLAVILLCTFHVKKHLMTIARGGGYGRLSSDDLPTLENHIHFCVYAKNGADYHARRQDLGWFCARVGFASFDAYFTRNWDNCVDMWVEFYRYRTFA